MHLLVRETRSLDEEQGAVDLGQKPAALVFLSFSDSDLGAVASAWQARATEGRPTLRLANLARLRHPMSVDIYVESVIEHASAVVIRLLGGLDYWRYGVEEIAAACRRKGSALAIVPGDARADERLAALSTVPADALAALDAYLAHGGPANLREALALAAQLGGIGEGPAQPPSPLPRAGDYPLAVPETGEAGDTVIVCYRSHLLAGDLAPIDALADALAARGLGVRALYASSLKDIDAASFVAERLRAWRPQTVLNATAFSARRDATGSPLDAAGAPVLQLVLAGTTREAWLASSRGLSQTDLAMQVVLPELDGRLLTTAIAFKEPAPPDPELDFARVVFRPDADGLAHAAAQAAGWARLAMTSRTARRVALVLSDYPGAAGGQVGHAVGLDALASTEEIARLLRDEGYAIGSVDMAAVTASLTQTAPRQVLDLLQYRTLFATLPAAARDRIVRAWGEPPDDIAIRHAALGNLLVAVQPDRGHALDRKAGYHDPDLPPCHAYVAFYLWLRASVGVDAIVHLGTHGTLEWLPGKATALSAACFPAVLAGGLPVIYPFIVNNPGEAAAAKRRLGAVTIGHLTPPLKAAGSHGAANELERLIDEYAAADGLDRRRTALLRREILDRAGTHGLLAESGVASGTPEDEALARLDAYLCDVKELQIRDGLHVYGRAPTQDRRAMTLASLAAVCPGVPAQRLAADLDRSPPGERTALLAALDGRLVEPGPAGAPTRGRADVLPTGRNLFTVDPRAIPTRSAVALAELAAEDLLRRHRQDHGDWPRALVLDLWGSTTMRTGGEDLALALLLIGARPVWDEGSARVSGIEIVPLATLDRPRVDVTLRISGLFRDAFEAQVLLFDTAIRMIAARDEAADWNGLAASARGLDGAALRHATARVFGPAPGAYGAGEAHTEGADIGAAYVGASAYAYGKDLDGIASTSAFADQITASDAFVHMQDHHETDLLEGRDYAAHEGGFAAAAHALGGTPALYHLDTSQPHAPRTRTVAEELARIVRGRAANPAWIAGMMRHGYRGGAEIARTLDALVAFATALPTRLDQQFDLVFDATLGDPAVDAFLRAANPDAHRGMVAQFRAAGRDGLWHARRNTVAAILVEATP